MFKLTGYGLVLLGLVWVGFLTWVAANEGPRIKPLMEWPLKAFVAFCAGFAVIAAGGYVSRAGRKYAAVGRPV